MSHALTDYFTFKKNYFPCKKWLHQKPASFGPKCLIVGQIDDQTLLHKNFFSLLEATKHISATLKSSAVLLTSPKLLSSITSQLHSLQKISLLDKIHCLTHDSLHHQLPEPTALALSHFLAHQPSFSHILFPSSIFGKNVAGRLAAFLRVPIIPDIIKIASPHRFVRPMYTGNILATLSLQPKQVMIGTIRTSVFQYEKGVSTKEHSAILSNTPIELPTASSTNWSRVIHTQKYNHGKLPNLPSAQVIVAGGRGFKTKDNFENLIYPLAKALNAGIGATRTAVDAGFISNQAQIGQSGIQVAANFYMALGLSGAIQHVAGIKDSKTIVAINSDPQAPIFRVSDYGLVGDINTAIPLLLQKIKENATQSNSSV